MKTYSPTVLNLLDTGRTEIVGIIKFELGSGDYGFVKANRSLVYEGLTYEPGGIINIPDMSYGSGIIARSLEIRLAASPDDGLTPELLATIEAEDYRDKRVVITDLHFHPDTGAFLLADVQWKGYIDTVSHEEDDTNGYTLVGRLSSRAQDYTRRNGRKRTHEDQQRRYPGDDVYKNLAKSGREAVYWGRVRHNPPANGGGGGGGGDSLGDRR